MRALWLAATVFATACAGSSRLAEPPSAAPRCDPGPEPRQDARIVQPGDALRIGETPCLSGSLILSGTQAGDAALPDLQTIEGDLIIRATSALRSFRAPNLQRVSGSIVIVDSPDLREIELPRLTMVAGDLIIGQAGSTPAGSTSLTRLTLPRLAEVGYALTFRTNPELTALQLPALRRVGGPVTIAGHRRLVDIRLPAELTFESSLTVAANIALQRLGDLVHVRGLGGDLVVAHNPQLTVLKLDALQTLRGRLEIHGHERLRQISLPSLQRMDGLSIIDNASLVALAAPRLSTIDGDTEVHGQPLLERLELRGIRQLGGSLDVTNNANLTTIALPAVTSIMGDLGLVDLPKLSTVRVTALQTIRNDLIVQQSGALTDVSLPRLAEVGGAVMIVDNAALRALGGLNALAAVADHIDVSNNAQLGACWPQRLASKLARRPRQPLISSRNGPPCPR